MLRIFYTCSKCGYQHPVIENGESFSPEKSLWVSHKDDRLNRPCIAQILNRVDESFSLDDTL